MPRIEEDLFVAPKGHNWKPYVAPSADLLKNYSESGKLSVEDIEKVTTAIVSALAKGKIEASVTNIKAGCRMTRFEVTLKDKKHLNGAITYLDAIRTALKNNDIFAFVDYKTNILCVEVPNKSCGTIGLKEFLNGAEYINAPSGSLLFGVGKNVNGGSVYLDLAKEAHLLIAGAEGSGKSALVNSMLASFLLKYGPEDLRLVIIDLKGELSAYNRLPHMMLEKVISDNDKAVKALKWALKETDRRFAIFSELGKNGVSVKNIDEYNGGLVKGEQRLCKIIIVINEFGECLKHNLKDAESVILRLIQKAHFCGIHLVLSTQNTDEKVLTPSIKCAMPTRIAFRVSSYADAQNILDRGGAEKLLGCGDLYLKRSGVYENERIQGCYISSEEVKDITDFIKANNETGFDGNMHKFLYAKKDESKVAEELAAADAKADALYLKCLKYCIEFGVASTTMIQKKFGIGYSKACKIIDWMECKHYISEFAGNKPRDILLSMDDFISIYGVSDD